MEQWSESYLLQCNYFWVKFQTWSYLSFLSDWRLAYSCGPHVSHNPGQNSQKNLINFFKNIKNYIFLMLYFPKH